MIKSLFLFSLLLLLLLKPISASNSNPLTRAHLDLTKYGFPVGLLPSSVRNYTLNQTSGDFSVELQGECRLTLPPDNYQATYSKKIKGKIEQSRIAELDGIRIRAYFKWWSVTGIRSSGDNVDFEVGMVTSKYPRTKFDESPKCDGQKSSS